MHLLLAVLLQLPAILMYHQVDDRAPHDALGRSLTISTQQFRDELRYMDEHHLRAVSADDYLKAVRAGQPTSNMVILTFDDGYEDQYTQALPILLEYGAHATFFITTGNVGKRNHVTWAQIRTMERSGMSIGGHSVAHIDLASLTPQQQRRQIEGCLKSLQLHVGIAADTYAYPGGTFDRATESVLQHEPIELAFTTDASHKLGYDQRFEITRIRVMPFDTIEGLSAELSVRHFALLQSPLH